MHCTLLFRWKDSFNFEIYKSLSGTGEYQSFTFSPWIKILNNIMVFLVRLPWRSLILNQPSNGRIEFKNKNRGRRRWGFEFENVFHVKWQLVLITPHRPDRIPPRRHTDDTWEPSGRQYNQNLLHKMIFNINRTIKDHFNFKSIKCLFGWMFCPSPHIPSAAERSVFGSLTQPARRWMDDRYSRV